MTISKAASTRKWTDLRRDLRMEWDLHLMLLAAVVFVLIFRYLPMGGLIMAFQEFDIFEGFRASPWVGLTMFKRVFATREFPMVLRNTLLISLYKILFFYPIPILVAIMLNEVTHSAYKRVVQTILYMPHFLSWVIVTGLVFDLFANTGVINRLISMLGGERQRFLMDASMFRSLVVGSAVWKEAGYSAIIFLAAIAAIDPTLYEAAVVDGASRMRQIIHVTIPGILPIIAITLLLRVGTIMDANVEQIRAMYNPTVYETGDVIGTYIYRIGLTHMEYSYATAVGLFNSVVSFTLVVLANTVSRRLVHRSLW
ncbi:MAG TPA: ABC transporter permease subunit [Clostridia bacterium]|nr:ABC transporter permease subunit [Clostridia bacterium]